MNIHSTNETKRVLATLRDLGPLRQATFSEALRIAELQAHRLLELWQVDDGPVPAEVVSELPRIRVVTAELPVSGASHWSGRYWVIVLNRHEPWTRRRFTLMHEFKHIVDHGHAKQLYSGNDRHSAHEQAELAADGFAGAVLRPNRLLNRAWGNGLQAPTPLGRYFGVSPQAADVRLAQTGLSLKRDRCGGLSTGMGHPRTAAPLSRGMA